jgi:uncharacterized protein YjbI with pentapeptide repeats
MKIVKPDNLALLTTPCRLEGRLCFSIAALACFSLEAPAGRQLLPEAELWPTAMAALGEGDVLDQGFPKPRAEFIVHAVACAPQPTPGMEITVRVGNVTKRLAVAGDRYWTASGAPGIPTPFVRLPVTYRNAFGGPGYAFNPLGKGFRPAADGRHPLPNVQYPGQALTSPRETPLPAGLCPYPADWPQRRSLLGRFDAAWLAERWPDLPRDASPDYFHTAPQDQRLQGFFRGDEEIRLVGLHPAQGTIVAALPRVRARIFVEQARGDAKEFIEVENRAETLMLYPEALRGILLFRGVVAVADEQLDDVTCLLAAWESQADAAQPIEKYFQDLQAALAPLAEIAAEGLPSPESAAEAEAGTRPAPPPLPSPEFEALHSELAALEAESDRRLQALGMGREEVIQKYGGAAQAPEAASFDHLAKEIEGLEQASDERLQALGFGREELLAKYGPPAADAPTDPAVLQGQVKELLGQALGQLAAADLTEVEAWRRLPPALQDEMPSLAAAQEALGRWEQQTVPAQTAPEGADAPDQVARPVLSAAEALARHQSGASLRGIDAAGQDFSGCDLQGADFSEALLDGACFAGAHLQKAIFANALLQAADLRDADLGGAQLHGATGPGADFSQARLAGADLSGADLRAANLSGALLHQADLSAGRLQGVVARGADFSDANLFRADLTGGDLAGADCSGADLTRAVLAEVRAPGLQLFGAVARQTDLRQAVLRGLRGGPGTLLEGVQLTGADLSEACLGGTHFIAVDLEGAALDRADFSRTRFEKCHLRNATARGSSFLKAAFRETDLRGLDLLQGSLRNATLEKVDLREASLYGVDFFGASLKQTDTGGANLKATLLTLMTSEKGAP